MTRPLLIIFLTIFVNLVGFGIIIPLLPFYAQTFGASPFIVGLLFAVFSLCQLIASPVLGDLSDRYGRRPVLIFSLAGTVVSFVMLALAHSIAMLFARADRRRAVGRQHLDGARVRRRRHGAEGSRARLRASRRGLRARLHLRPGAERCAGAGSATRRRSGRRPAITLVATIMAWLWLPETVHRAHAGTGNPLSYLPELLDAPDRPARARDRLRVLVRARDLSDDVRACSWPRGSGSMPARTGYLFAGFGLLGAIVQGGFIRPIVQRLGDKTTFMVGLVFGAIGLVGRGCDAFGRRCSR